MPTDLDAVRTRKRKTKREKEKQTQTIITMLSLWAVVCLIMLVLLFVDKSYAQAMEELMFLF
jgi:hypothetical protein